MTEVITLGCRLNLAESEAIGAMLAGAEDLVVINSCAVTNEAVRQTRQAIRRAHRARPDARIVVTGCAAQIDPHSFAAMPEVTRVVGNADKLNASSYKPSPLRGEGWERGCDGRSNCPSPRPSPRRGEGVIPGIFSTPSTAPHLASGLASHARAFVEVQTGCDHRCTFCIIPYGRGNSRAAAPERVMERIRGLVDDGYREVVLTGVDLTSHPDLAGLIEHILYEVPALPRLRLSSLDPAEVDDRLFALLTQEPRIMPHVHLSLQAGDDMILKRMKRRHSRAQAVALVERLKAARPEIAIGADLIAGFPTETGEMAANSLAALDDCDVVFGHIFPFSPRDGTPAARMPQVDRAVVKARAKQLRVRAAERQAKWLKVLVGTRQHVLIELDRVTGHAENFASARLSPSPSGEGLGWGRSSTTAPVGHSPPLTPPLKGRGSIMDVLITATTPTTLIAEPLA